MIYNAYRAKEDYNLVEEYFELNINNTMLPFSTTIVPVVLPLITLIKKGKLHIIGDTSIGQNTLSLTGQYMQACNLEVNVPTIIAGIALHPTALYKLTGHNMASLTNKFIALETVSEQLTTALLPLFHSNTNKKIILETFKTTLKQLPKINTKHTRTIDYAIKYIRKKEGLLNVTDLLDTVSISQKTLELKFKEIVGITPGKYIKLYRFLKLMRKYANSSIKIKDLIFMYDYYDESHFSKEFKLFMNVSPKEYFSKDHSFLSDYLKE